MHLDVTMIQEVGVNWSKVSRNNQWKARAGKHLDPNHTQSFMSYNHHDPTSHAHQWGGTGIMSYGRLAHHSAGAGGDNEKLGRWAWARYMGKDGIRLRCVSVYRPCEGGTGTETVSAQQRQYFLSKNEDKEPRQAWLIDFEAALQSWLAAGDQIIVGGDLNDDVRSELVTNLFTRCGMYNVMADKHDLQNGPTTYSRGTNIIDGLWATPGIDVTACGYLEPNATVGDHSLLWMDVTYSSALGHAPEFPNTFKARRLRLHDNKTVQRYLNRYEQYVEEQRLVERQIRLKRTTMTGVPLTAEQAMEADAIDELKTAAMKKAENKCRKLRMGEVAFSEATEAPKRRICFWLLAIKRRTGRRVSVRLWRRKKVKAKITESLSALSMDDLNARLLQARLDYRQAKKKHKEERLSFLATFSEKDRKRLLRVEKQRELGRIAKAVTGKLGNKSVFKVEYQGRECNSQKEVETALFNVNEAKYRASDDTPFMQEPLLSSFGYGNNQAAKQQVYEGTFQCPPGTDPYAELLIKHLARPDRPPNVPLQEPRTTIMPEDHEKAWKKAKERTACGYSGLHFGMYKAHLKRPMLAALDASMRAMAYRTGFSYKRWKRGVNVQLLKRKRDFRAEKLRTIVLLEADFNMNNKALGSDVMKTGERYKWFTKDNYGGRKHHVAPEVSLNSRLTCDSIRGKRARAIIISNDAKGCYDRIAHTVLRLALGRLGVPDPPVESMLETIQLMEHYLCTAFGVSTETYGADPSLPPPQGMLQGNGAGPAGWFAISSVLLDTMKAQGFGMRDWSLIRKRVYEIGGFAFVDDTDLVHTNPDPNVSNEDLIAEAQQALNTWHGLIRATGGDLAPEKGYWYFIDMHWKNGKWVYKTIAETPGDLWIPGCTEPIRRLEVTEAQEALGIQSSPDGSSVAETKYLVDKVTQWTDAIRSKRVKLEDAWYCLNSTIYKTIEYPLMATTLSRAQVYEIMNPLLRVILNRIGVQKNLPRKLVYGTLKSRGLGLYDIFWLQLCLHLTAVIKHHHRDTPTGNLLEANMDLVQFYVGSDQNFWDLPYEMYGMLAPEGWIKHTWEAMSQSPLQLKGPHLSVPAKRFHDIHLMDAFVDFGYDPGSLCLLNEARLYLQAVTLADISTADGIQIDMDIWRGYRSHHYKVGATDWIPTHPLTPSQRTLWQTALRQVFLHPQATHLRLRHQLGPWKQAADVSWQWWYHTPSNTLYQRGDHGIWQRRRMRTRRGNRSIFDVPTNILETHVPSGLLRASVTKARGAQFVSLIGIGTNTITPVTEVDTVTAALSQLPASSQWAVRTVKMSDNGVAIASALRNGTAIAVSDGSLKLNVGTSAFVVCGPDDIGYISGANQVPGTVSDGDSHRCELAGIYGVVVLVDVITDIHNIHQGSICLACDNEQALRVFHPDYVPDPKYANFDLMNAIWHKIKSSNITWTAEHVYGHQEKKRYLRKLTRKEKLNVAMDKLAKLYWVHLLRDLPQLPYPCDIPFDGEGWQIWNGDKKITNPSTKNLYEQIQDETTQLWWVRHGHLDRDARHSVDWKATADMMNLLQREERQYVTKAASDNCGIGVTQVKWRFQTDANCPRCGATEDAAHVYRCKGWEADKTWNTSLQSLREYMTSTKTAPELQEAIETCLHKWRTKQLISLHLFHPDVRPIIAQQKRIGWRQLLEGLAGTSWRSYQHQHYVQQRSRKSSKKWISGLLVQLVRLGRRQWLHRNDIKHGAPRPRHQRMITLLKQEILRIFSRGHNQVLFTDRKLFQRNVCILLRKSLPFRQRWLLNTITAIEFKARANHNDPDYTTITPDQQLLLDWIRTGRAS